MSYRAVTAICVALCCVALVVGDYQLPAGVNTCKKDADDFSSCLRLAMQESWPVFMAGLPDFEIPILDPYFVETHVTSYDSGQLRGTLSASNCKTYGFAKARFLSVKPEYENDVLRLEMEVDVPKILIEGEYKADGSLGSYQLGGSGVFNISIGDVKVNWDITGRVVDDRWVVEHFRVTPEIGSLRLWFSDLFNGDEGMNRAAMYFANEYWPLIYRGMLPKLRDSWDTLLTEMVNHFFSKVPFSTLFP
ncbi:protein takeout [Lasioglossum baleicum]|uniref:protein takeout n=1 Tax=Lasioglossum baleicum TaxID=434251 RepID=UPI003FCD16BD